jgi:hypothetical protein
MSGISLSKFMSQYQCLNIKGNVAPVFRGLKRYRCLLLNRPNLKERPMEDLNLFGTNTSSPSGAAKSYGSAFTNH